MLADPDYAKTGRMPIIYAHLPDGSEVVVPDNYEPGEAPAPNATADHVEMAAKPTVTPAPDAGKAPAEIDLPPFVAFKAVASNTGLATMTGEVLASIDPLAVFPGVKKILPRHLDMLEAAQAGSLPQPPDTSPKSWEGPTYRGRCEKLTAMVAAGDIAGLEAEQLPHYDSGFRAMARYRNLAVIALKARAARRL